ncbi:MAG: Gx transporter family protein [Oscillospiraceae bacterium]|nr:Gx transporter family protein [Christensenellales bacterium]PWM06362.1 MAG: heptaprenyl diphosphate synthase [Clostridiales bacterium]HIR69396.1 Gx transporter family protein [Candidatus Pelethousia gallinarum]
MKAKNMARFGLLIGLALVLGYVESVLPIAPGLPGVKLGLGNTVLLFGLYMLGEKQTVWLMLGKVLLSGLLFGTPSAYLYSLAGGICSLCAMWGLRRLPGMGLIGVSVGGAVCHNLGQLAVAALVVGTAPVLSYLPILLVSAIITGMITGVAAKATISAMEAIDHSKREKK